MRTRNKSGPNIELSETPALILAQDELWPLRKAISFLFLKKTVKRPNKYSEIPKHSNL